MDSPYLYLEALNERISFLDGLIKRADKIIAESPPGSLVAYKGRKSYQYYQKRSHDEKHGIYIPQKDIHIAEQLAKKEYYVKLKESALEEKKCILKGISEIKHLSVGPEDIYKTLPKPRQNLISPIFYPDDEYVARWKAVEYRHKPFDKTAPEHYTDNNERVRSKSEVMIANALFHSGVPYRYEYPIVAKDGETRHPDFYCLNIRTRKEIIWEHYGRMDDVNYVTNNIGKTDWYEQEGFKLGESMIFTLETQERPLNKKMIERKIELYLK